MEGLKDGNYVRRACDADNFGNVDDVGEDVFIPICIDADERNVVEAACKLKQEPIVTVCATNSEELAPFHFEVKRHASCCSESIVANLLESFEFEDTFVHLGDGVANASAGAHPQETLGGAQGESVVKRF